MTLRHSRGAATLAALLAFCFASPSFAACPVAPQQAEVWIAIEGADDGIGGSGHAPKTVVASESSDGIGGSGYTDGDEDGIGGSGYGDGDEDGIGGSGLLGTVTGFGSICINGRRITYDADVAVTLGGATAGIDVLNVGQVVRIVAQDEKAASIDVLFAVVGMVEKQADGAFTVHGQAVRTAAGALVTPALITAGNRVAVSGLRHPDGTIIASRVESAGPSLEDGVQDFSLDKLFATSIEQVDVEGYVNGRDDSVVHVGSARFETNSLQQGVGAVRPGIGARVRIRAMRREAGDFDVRRLEVVPPTRLNLVPSSPRFHLGDAAIDNGSRPGRPSKPTGQGPGGGAKGGAPPPPRGPMSGSHPPPHERPPRNQTQRPERFDRPEPPDRPKPADRPNPFDRPDFAPPPPRPPPPRL